MTSSFDPKLVSYKLGQVQTEKPLIPSSVMEKIASITAALDAGKYPSTEQLNALIEWLTHSVVQPSENNLSGQGRVLANDIRGVLDSYQLLNSNKNRT
jgi:hypothetical protein